MSSFNKSHEVRGFFLGISNAFDKVWHKVILFNLKKDRIADDLLNVVINFLKSAKQRVVLNGQNYLWEYVIV